MSPSARPATPREARCSQVPHQPRKCHPCPAASRATKKPHKCHACRNEGGCHQVPRLPRQVKVDVTKRHACHAKVPRRPARPRGPKARHQTQPSSISATPAAQNEGGCHQVPRLPRQVKVDVTECHTCHAK